MKGKTLKRVMVVVAVVFVSIVLAAALPVISDVADAYDRDFERACENATGGCGTVPDCDRAGEFYPGPGWLWCPVPVGVLGGTAFLMLLLSAVLKLVAEGSRVEKGGGDR